MAVLLLSGAGAGKTARVQDELLRLKTEQPLAKAWVLLSTDRQIYDFRRRFAERGRVFFNVETFNFYTLYTRILAMARQPGRVLPPRARDTLIRALLRHRFSGAPVFGQIAGTPGFAAAVAGLIDELKQHRIMPDAFIAAAQNQREAELAAMYAEYLMLLQENDLIDQEGEGWLVIEALQAFPSLASDVKLLIVDGYDQFNPLQVGLLAELDKQVERTIITLPTAADRQSTIGRRFQRSRERLREAFGDRLNEEGLPPSQLRPEAVRHLLDRLLMPHVADPTRRDEARLVRISNQIRWIEAPDPSSEAAAVMRRVKRLILLEGCKPDDMLIAVRDWRQYGRHLATHAHLYGIPLALHFGDAPDRNPAIAALIDLLALHRNGFLRRDVLDVLRSPYFAIPGLPSDAVDILDRISREARVIGGIDEWGDAIRLAAWEPQTSSSSDSTVGTGYIPSVSDSSSSDDEDDVSASRMGLAYAESVYNALMRFFDAITPPETGMIEDYVRWLESLIGHDAPDPDEAGDALPESPAFSLNMPSRIRSQESELVARDLAAMKRLKDVLRSLIANDGLAAKIDLPRENSREEFLSDLLAALGEEPVERGAGRGGQVLATTAANARGLPHSHVFIVGLAEGIFPALIPDDPLLLDSERGRLREAGIELADSSDRAADDGVFYGLIGLACESLTLSRPYVKKAEIWAESHLWTASRAVFDRAEVETATTTIRMDGGATFEDAASLSEAALAAAEGLRRGIAGSGAAVRWLAKHHPAQWGHIRHAAEVERRRMTAPPRDAYSGVLSDSDLIAHIAADIDGRTWSASALNDYGSCPFKFYAHRLLGIEPLEDPEDGMDVRQRGTLMHEILERIYRHIAADGLAIHPDNVSRALEILEAVCDDLLPGAPERLGFRASPVWIGEQVTIRRKLATLIGADFSQTNPLKKLDAAEGRYAYRQEAKFGSRIPMVFDLGGGVTIRVRGTIDRMDGLADGGVVIVDYKSGATKIESSEIRRGRNFQMLVYLEAAAQFFASEARPVVGGVFWHISDNSGSGALSPYDEEGAEALEAGKAHLRDYLARMRRGDFRSRPNKLESGKCASYCEFYQFCRAGIMKR